MDMVCKVLVFFAIFYTVTAEIYIVTMEGDPIISYKGGVNGFEATAVESDEKIDTTRYPVACVFSSSRTILLAAKLP